MPTGFIHGTISVYILYCLIWYMTGDIGNAGWMTEGSEFEFLKEQDFLISISSRSVLRRAKPHS
jgi:hypothetical protein